MTHNLKRAVLLLTLVTTSISLHSCKDESGNDRDDLSLVMSHNMVDKYFKPKKAFVYPWNQTIRGNWFFNEKAADNVDFDFKVDTNQEFAEHYYFLDNEGIKKYSNAQHNSDSEIMLDSKDIISPYKEYSDYFKDNNHITGHEKGFYNPSSIQACVVPVTAIDVTCDKDFDANHPAGTPLNDIIKYEQDYDTYAYLNTPEKNGQKLYWGLNLVNTFEARSLADLPNNPVYMMDSGYQLTFDHEPAAPGTYEFTVKFTFGPDPLSGETVDIAPAKVSIEF